MIEIVNITVRHRESLVRILNNKNVEKWLLKVPSPYTLSDADDFIRKNTIEPNNGIDFSYFIESDGKLVGGIGLHKKFEHSAEVGYWIGEEYWGKGFGTIALKKIVDKAFDEFKFKRVQAHTFEGNIASEKILLKNGFEFEGLLKKYHKKGNIFYNSKLFSKITG